MTLDQVQDWQDAYVASKKYAELVLWDFIETQSVNFKLKTICTPAVFGPMRIPPDTRANFNVTNQWVLNAFNGTQLPLGYTEQESIYADVRYVAQAHVAAADKRSPRTDKRYLIYNEKFNFPQVYEWMAKRYRDANVYHGPVYGTSIPLKYDISETEKDLGPLRQYALEQTLTDLFDQYDQTPINTHS